VQRVVVVGASVAGLRAVESLRRNGFAGEILVIGGERWPPYNRPPLSKTVLTATELPGFDEIALPLSPRIGDVQWRLGVRAAALDVDARVVVLEDGQTVEWDGLVIATGLRPVRLAVPGPTVRRYVLRNFDDARALRDVLQPGARLVVIGAGFIGCEVASAARERGVHVVVVGRSEYPLPGLGDILGSELRRLHETHGVRFLGARAVVAFEGTDHVRGVVLDDGTELAADIVVEAIGGAPETDWLVTTKLDIHNGVRCDGMLRALDISGQPIPNVVACGDVARVPLLRGAGIEGRVEHWSMAIETGRYAGRTLAASLSGAAAGAPSVPMVPTFWSDQYGVRLSGVGLPEMHDGEIRVRHDSAAGEVAISYFRAGRLIGIAALGCAARLPEFYDAVRRSWQDEGHPVSTVTRSSPR
jgi:3-phenylpropionate/trans-cinnamate dioxygenase ferredoxin reductase subunit